MASFLSFLLGEKKKTASVAKERLQIILAHERSGRNAGAAPDYLPALLEFAALAPAEGEILLNELRTPLELVRTRLHSLGSPYALLLDEVVSELPKPTAAQIAAARRLADGSAHWACGRRRRSEVDLKLFFPQARIVLP